MPSNATPLDVLAVGSSDAGDFSSWLGRPHQISDETYVMVQASVAIASGSQGLQLQTAISSGIGSFVVVLSTGGVSNALVCGAIPSSLVGPIAASAYFWALRDSYAHVLRTIPATTGAIIAYEPLKVTTGAGLQNIYTGSQLSALTGVASTSSGVGVLNYDLMYSAGKSLEAGTGVALITGMCSYRAPFRGST